MNHPTFPAASGQVTCFWCRSTIPDTHFCCSVLHEPDGDRFFCRSDTCDCLAEMISAFVLVDERSRQYRDGQRSRLVKFLRNTKTVADVEAAADAAIAAGGVA